MRTPRHSRFEPGADLAQSLGPQSEVSAAELALATRAIRGDPATRQRYDAWTEALEPSLSASACRALNRRATSLGEGDLQPEQILFALLELYGRVASGLGRRLLRLSGNQSVQIAEFIDENSDTIEGTAALGRCLDRVVDRLPGGQRGRDLLGPLYLALVPRAVRHDRGEYFTPDWLAHLVVERTVGPATVDPTQRVLDPCCGSGVFLAARAAVLSEALLRTGQEPEAVVRAVTGAVAGLDINPLATLATRVNLWATVADLLPHCAEPPQWQVHTTDLFASHEPPADYLVGNPPWVSWESLSRSRRRRTRKLWQAYGLFGRSGMEVILGQGKRDLSTLVTLDAAHRLLRPGGQLGFVLPRSLIKSPGAGREFRRFVLPDGTPLGPQRAEDIADLRPFDTAAARAVVLVLRKGAPVSYPLPYIRRRPSSDRSPAGEALPQQAQPVDPKDPASAWFTAEPELLEGLQDLLGPSAYRAREGANTGGANGVYWLEIIENLTKRTCRVRNLPRCGRRQVEVVDAELERALVYPLLRGRDVAPWRAEPSLHLLLAQDPDRRQGLDPELMASRYPRTLRYLNRFEAVLRSRAAFVRYFGGDRPFWSMFNINRETLAPWKVVWREQSRQMTAAVVGPQGRRPVIPDHKLMLVACSGADEAHYLCALLNAAPVRQLVQAYAVQTQLSTHILRHVAIPTHDRENPLHRRLVKLSRRAQRIVAADGQTAPLEAQLVGLAMDAFRGQ